MDEVKDVPIVPPKEEKVTYTVLGSTGLFREEGIVNERWTYNGMTLVSFKNKSIVVNSDICVPVE